MCACVCGWSKKKEGYACCIVRVCIHTYIWRHKYWLMNVRGWAWSAPKAKGFARWKLLKTVGCCSTLYIIHTHTRGCIVHELIQYTSNGACLCNQCFAALQRKGGGAFGCRPSGECRTPGVAVECAAIMNTARRRSSKETEARVTLVTDYHSEK